MNLSQERLAVDAAVHAYVTASFSDQGFMRTLNANLVSVTHGRIEIHLPITAAVCQQNGYVHAGALTTLLDNACGLAALSVGGIGRAVLTIEFKVNLLEPACGEHIEAIGVVLRPGRTTVCTGEAYAVTTEERTRVAIMQATMAVRPRTGG